MKLSLNPFIEQVSEKGRPFRVSGLEKKSDTESWVGRQLKNDYIITIKFLDTNKFASLHQDKNGKIYQIDKI